MIRRSPPLTRAGLDHRIVAVVAVTAAAALSMEAVWIAGWQGPLYGDPWLLLTLVLLGSIFKHQADSHGVTVGELFAAGMIAGGIGSASFQNLGLNIANERDGGVLKRLRGEC